MIDEATKGKHCNASCCDYYCPQNVSGRCQAPNKCLGVEEAAELIAELEAAKREIAALRKRERGDCAKLREALEKCANWGEQIDCQLGSSDETVYTFRDERCLAHNISECARAALAAPPRNCDVGTAEEQSKRLHRFCISHDCATCTCNIGKADGRCAFVWAQMPYEKGGAK